jgi:hypothetical protein
MRWLGEEMITRRAAARRRPRAKGPRHPPRRQGQLPRLGEGPPGRGSRAARDAPVRRQDRLCERDPAARWRGASRSSARSRTFTNCRPGAWPSCPSFSRTERTAWQRGRQARPRSAGFSPSTGSMRLPEQEATGPIGTAGRRYFLPAKRRPSTRRSRLPRRPCWSATSSTLRRSISGRQSSSRRSARSFPG